MVAFNKLICGNPEEKVAVSTGKPASSTRFVFPFSYTLELSQVEKGELVFIENRGDDEIWQARKRYFTHETSEILFSNTKWFQIEPKTWESSTWRKGDPVYLYPTFSPDQAEKKERKVQISMLPPQLVLFEYQEKKKGEADQDGRLQSGFLLLDIFFPEVKGVDVYLEDMLLLNELFRYFQRPFPGHEITFNKVLRDVPVNYEGERKTVSKNLNNLKAYQDRWLNLLEVPIKISGESRLRTIARSKTTDLVYKDERCYVWSSAMLEEGGCSLQKQFRKEDVNIRAHRYGHWVKFLNIDMPEALAEKNHLSTEFERQWAKDRTYHRWEGLGSWYGFSYHSGVMLAPAPQAGDPPFWQHFRRMYFDMALLLFYLRVTLFRFSREIFELQKKQDADMLHDYSVLRKDFLNFSIRYQFPLLSNQQQAIEMYEIVRRHFNIDELYKEIEKEIEAMYNFVEMENARNLSKKANWIAKLGIPFAIISMVCSLVDIYNIDNEISIFLLFLSLVVSLVISFCFT